MCLGAQQHAAHEVGGGDAGGALNDLESTRGLDEAVAVVAIAVGGYIVAVNDVFASIVRDEGEGCNVGGVGYGAGDPATGVRGGETIEASS